MAEKKQENVGRKSAAQHLKEKKVAGIIEQPMFIAVKTDDPLVMQPYRVVHYKNGNSDGSITTIDGIEYKVVSEKPSANAHAMRTFCAEKNAALLPPKPPAPPKPIAPMFVLVKTLLTFIDNPYRVALQSRMIDGRITFGTAVYHRVLSLEPMADEAAMIAVCDAQNTAHAKKMADAKMRREQAEKTEAKRIEFAQKREREESERKMRPGKKLEAIMGRKMDEVMTGEQHLPRHLVKLV